MTQSPPEKDAPASITPDAGPSPVRLRAAGWAWLLVAGGLAVCLLGMAWWMTRANNAGDDISTSGAGAVTFDVDQARRETEDLQQRVMQAMTSKQPVDLLPQVRQLVERYPRFAPAHTLLGQMLLQRDQLDQAYQSLDMSLRLDSQQPQVHQLAGTIAQGLGRHEDATRHFTQAVGLEPDNVRFRLFLAQSYTQTQQFDQARMTLLHALRMRADFHEAYYLLSVLDARQGSLSQALTQAQRAIDHLPDDGKGPLEPYVRWQARLLQRDNRPADALTALLKLPAPSRYAPEVLEDMAVSCQMLGQPERGAALYEDALSHHPGQWALAAGAAKWYAKAGDTAAARRMIDAARRINPHRPPPEASPPETSAPEAPPPEVSSPEASLETSHSQHP